MTEDSLIGRQLANFKIERFIGRGGMAQVYYGWDVKLQRPVAIKMIDVRLRGNPAYAERFVREAQAVATWRHQHIVQIYYADDEDGLYYFVMEYIDGQDLGRLMTQYGTEGELMPHEEVLWIGRAFAEALDYAHRQGVIHRDVKPSNLMVAHDGRVVLTDFGLAMDVEQGSLGEVFGSAHYIAPEQARRSANAVPQSDLYSLGVILFEMLTGRVPFDDPSPTTVAVQHITMPPPPAREINPQLNAATETVLAKALSKAPEERYQTGRELIEALAKALQANQPSEPATPIAPVSLPGDLVGQQLDEYRLEALLGRGGMARVYRGLDVRLNRRVAIKVIDTPFRTDSEYAKRFEREAQAVAQLEHPHIVSLYRYGETRGLLYMAMQYVEGQNLRSVLAGYRQEQKSISPQEIVRIIREVCLALDYAHGKGVIHRDVKPSNIMLNAAGEVYLADFGLALLTEIGTQGEILGSPHYIAPEQAISSANVVPQSDLYAVGVILYEMFTGELPFDEADPLEVAMLHISEPPPDPQKLRPDLSPNLAAVLLKALAKSPGERYPTGAALVEALEQALQQEPVGEAAGPPPTVPRKPAAEEAIGLPPVPAAVAPQPAEPSPEPPSITSVISTKVDPTVMKPSPAPSRRKRTWLGIAALIAALLIVLLIGLWWFNRDLGGQVETAVGDQTPVTEVTEPAAGTGIQPSPTSPAPGTPAAATGDRVQSLPERPSPTGTDTPEPAMISSTLTLTPTLTPTPTPTRTYRLAFTRWDGSKHSVWLVDSDGSNQQFLLNYGASPSWSADGRNIAFLGEEGIAGGSRGVWRMSGSGWGATQLKQDGAARSVTWMPGGTTIAYDSDRGDYRVYFVDFYGTDLPVEILGEQPAWSPDGSRLVVRACRPDCGLWVVNRDGANSWQFSRGSSDSFPAWSPDGKQIAFSRGSSTDIFVSSVDGSDDPRQLTESPGHDTLPLWTPDGQQLIFRTTRNGRWQIYMMNVDGLEQQLLVDQAAVSSDWAFDRMSIIELKE